MFPLDDFARAAAADEKSYLRKIRKNGRIGANQLLWDLDVDDAFNDTLVQEKRFICYLENIRHKNVAI